MEAKYKLNDLVTALIETDDGIVKITGHILVVDENGTFEQQEEPSYDIMAPFFKNCDQDCLYKHIRESHVYDPKDTKPSCKFIKHSNNVNR